MLSVSYHAYCIVSQFRGPSGHCLHTRVWLRAPSSELELRLRATLLECCWEASSIQKWQNQSVTYPISQITSQGFQASIEISYKIWAFSSYALYCTLHNSVPQPGQSSQQFYIASIEVARHITPNFSLLQKAVQTACFSQSKMEKLSPHWHGNSGFHMDLWRIAAFAC